MRIALAQINPVVGDIPGNTAKIAGAIDRAAEAAADLAVFCELSILGYPPRDLLRKERLVHDCEAAVAELAGHCTKTAALVGTVRANPAERGRPLQNAAVLLADGAVRHVHVKSLLPTYDVFDETRYFEPGPPSGSVEIAGRRVGLSVCEDLWDAAALGRELYGTDPIDHLAQAGAEVVVNMAASPFQMGKAAVREDLFRRQARRAEAPVVYVNQVGGNDELVFDGTSCVVDASGEVVARAKGFAEDLVLVDLAEPAGRVEPLEDELARLSRALKLGLRDYVTKCGFSSVVLGLSGGIDSAVVAVLAADALGGENVHALLMPSRYSSDHSVADAEQLARNLGLHWRVIGIEAIHRAYEQVAAAALAGGNTELAEENIQARIRGNLVMAVSNAHGHLPLATGNKSELSVGYCTLYGDMSGGLSPIGDVLKTVTYKLAEQLDGEGGRGRMPPSILTKPPSAELKPNQFDQDKLPPYNTLDAILSKYIEDDWTGERIIAAGHEAATVRRVLRMVDAAEYKRRQAAPVLKVTARAFGTGRRMPIAQRFPATQG